MNEEEPKYISLQEATKYCPYSQDYLSLRARQEKLRAIKIGRNWITTKEWVEEYLKKVEEYNNNFKISKTVAPPENLPVAEEPFAELLFPKVDEKFPLSKIRFGFALTLIFVFIVAGAVFGKDSIKSVFEDIDSYVTAINQSADKGIVKSWTGINNAVQEVGQTGDFVLKGVAKSFEESFVTVSEDISQFSEDLSRFGGKAISTTGEVASFGLAGINQLTEVGQRTSASIFDSIKGIGQGIAEGIKGIGQGVKNIVLSLIKDISRLVTKPKEEIPEEPIVPKPAREGLAVIPSTEKDEEVKEKIKESFSDEVKVEPEDETSGIIIPIFREREGEKYLYILVPLRY